MQTFLPEPTFSASAAALDNKRLGKQRVEVLQLLNALKQGPVTKRAAKEPACQPGTLGLGVVYREIKTPWYNHPACKMWRGWEQSLIDYGLIVCIEWTRRGFKDTCYDKILDFADWAATQDQHDVGVYDNPAYSLEDSSWHPEWYNEAFIRAHRSNLIRKDPKFYQPKWPDVPNDLPYVWPVQ